jgi:uncharacterized protein (DUF433 family)
MLRRERPAYSFAEAAHYLRRPVSTVRAWFQGQSHRFNPVIALSDSAVQALSFANLVEAHVLSAIRWKHGVSLQRVRRALDYARNRLGVMRPLIDQDFETNGVDLFVQELGDLVNASQGGQLAMKLRTRLDRIERDSHGIPIKLFPFTRPTERAEDARLVVIDPEVAFGRPAIAGNGAPTDVIAERYLAGESIPALAVDFGTTLDAIEEALRCELQRKAA